MNSSPENLAKRYQIGDLLLDSGSRSVKRGDDELRLGALTFDLLQALAEAAPNMASYDYLADKVWDGRPVSPETIAQRAKILRAALDDDAKNPRYFELIRGQGYRLVVEVTDGSTETELRPKRNWAGIAAAAIIIVALAFAPTILRDDASTPSVAVLPFADLSETGDKQYFADGVAEEIINELAGLEGLEVASRTESFYFRGPSEDLQSVGRKLDVTAVLEGSIRSTENALRVTVQLIDVDSGFHLWSKNFDSELQDIFDIQETIAVSVAGALGVELGVGGINEFHGAGTRNIDAYEAFLQQDYAKAIELDPLYASAWANCGVDLGSRIWNRPPELAPEIIAGAESYVERAIELDPESAITQTGYGLIVLAKLEWAAAHQAFAKSLTLRRDPDSLRHAANFFMRVGDSRRSLSIREEGDALKRYATPLPFFTRMMRSQVDIAMGRFDEAKQLAESMPPQVRYHTEAVIALNEGSKEGFKDAVASMPTTNPTFEMLFVPIAELIDTPDEALDFVMELADDPIRTWPSKYENIAVLAAFLGYPEQSLEIFSRELRLASTRYGSLWYPVMSDVRKLPAFKDLMVEVGLVDYWHEYSWPDLCRPVGTDDFICE